MADPVTKEQLINAGLDSTTIEEVVNESATYNGTGVVTSRLGTQLKTLAKLSETFDDALVDAYSQIVIGGAPLVSCETVALLTSLNPAGLTNNQIVVLKGYHTAIDGGGQLLVYKDSGRTGITVDNGFYFNGPDTDDYFEALDKSKANVKCFGAKGDAINDDKSAFEAARDAAVNEGTTSTVYIPAGTYMMDEFNIYTTASSNIQYIGEPGVSKIRAYTNAKFAWRTPVTTFTQPQFAPMIKNLVFDGTDGSTAKKRCGLLVYRRINIENCDFEYCLIGLLCTGNYYGHYKDLNFLLCDVGIWFGTFSADLNISDLRDSVGASTSVTLPEGTPLSTVHSGNKLLTAFRANQCRIGIIAGGDTNEVPRLTFTKATIEGCTIGCLCYSGMCRFEQPWFENFVLSGSGVINGLTFETNYGLVAGKMPGTGTYQNIGGHIQVYGGRVAGGYAHDGGLIFMDDGAFLLDSYGREDKGGFKGGHIAADLIAFPGVARSVLSLNGNGRAVTTHANHKLNRVIGSPFGGNLHMGYDFATAGSYPNVARYGGTLLSFKDGTPGNEGGIWPERSYALHTDVASNNGLVLNIQSDVNDTATDNTVHLILVTFKPELDCNLVMSNISLYLDLSSFTCKGGEWNTVIACGRKGEPTTDTPRILCRNQASTMDVEWSAIQVIQFDNPADAITYQEGTNIYLES